MKAFLTDFLFSFFKGSLLILLLTILAAVVVFLSYIFYLVAGWLGVIFFIFLLIACIKA